MKQLLFFGFLLVVLVVGSPIVMGQDDESQVQIGAVMNVVDGDTIDVDIDGDIYRVRYIGINTPESNEVCGADATEANQALVGGKRVALQRDVSETDPFDRLLRYVYVDGLFVNATLVADGWAEAVEYPPDTAFAEWFSLLEADAVADELGCHPTGVFGEAEPAAQGVTVTATSQVNLRGGPGTNYPVAGSLAAHQTAAAVARNAAGDWLVLESGAWVAAWVVTVQGDVTTLPVREAPPVPEAPPPAQPQPTQALQSTLPPSPPTQPPQPTSPPAPVWNCGGDLYNCGDFTSCTQVMDYFLACPGDPSRLDGDNDGVPCESLCQ